MSKLQDFLQEKKVDSRRLLAASAKLEGLRSEDRQVRAAKARVRSGKASDAEKELAAKKPRSGKAVSRPLLSRALAGNGSVSGPAKARILRAVNTVLEKKSLPAASQEDLF